MVSKSIYTPVSQDIEKSINYKSKRPNTLWAKYCKFVVILSGILTLILTTVFGLNMAYSYQTTNVTEEVDVVTLNVTDTTLPTASTTLNVTDTTLPTASTTLPTASTTLPTASTTPTVQDEEETDVVTTLPTASTTLPTASTTLNVTDTTPTVQDEEETDVVTTTEPLVNPKKIFNMLQEDNGEYTTETDSPEEIQELKDTVISNKTIVIDSSNQSIIVTN
jgi:hypothetical protein